MNNITFADPRFLYLLILVPLMLIYYVLRQHKATASIRLSSLEFLQTSNKTFRFYLQQSLFAIRLLVIALLTIVLARPQSTDRWSDSSTQGIDIMIAFEQDIDNLIDD